MSIPRSGATLIEVLVAIFVMGIGLIALLTLFPLGALRMAQAIQNDRCHTASHTAAALLNMKNIRFDSSIYTANDSTGTPYDIMADVDGPTYKASGKGLAFPASSNGPSYPVLVDPTGYRTTVGLNEDWVANLNDHFWRRTVSFVTNSKDAIRWFTLLDDIYFDGDGLPRFLTGTTFERDNRHSWAILLQRPKTSDKTVVNASIVVYQQRPLGLSGNLSLNEFANNNVSFDVAKNTMSWNYASATTPPVVRAGDWIMDAHRLYDWTNNLAYPHANFYRVVGVSEPATNQIELEVTPSLRGFAQDGAGKIVSLTSSSAVLTDRTVVLMEGVVDVFEKGPGKSLE